MIELERRRDSLEDDPGRPVTATTKRNIDRLHNKAKDDMLSILNQILVTIYISHERAENILNNELGLTEFSARWVPRLLIPGQKCTLKL